MLNRKPRNTSECKFVFVSLAFLLCPQAGLESGISTLGLPKRSLPLLRPSIAHSILLGVALTASQKPYCSPLILNPADSFLKLWAPSRKIASASA